MAVAAIVYLQLHVVTVDVGRGIAGRVIPIERVEPGRRDVRVVVTGPSAASVLGIEGEPNDREAHVLQPIDVQRQGRDRAPIAGRGGVTIGAVGALAQVEGVEASHRIPGRLPAVESCVTAATIPRRRAICDAAIGPLAVPVAVEPRAGSATVVVAFWAEPSAEANLCLGWGFVERVPNVEHVVRLAMALGAVEGDGDPGGHVPRVGAEAQRRR